MSRKGIPWGPKNPLWRWRKKKGLLGKGKKAYKSKTVKRVTRLYHGGKMKRKGSRRSFTLPIAPIAGLLGAVVGARPGWNSVAGAVQKGDWNDAGNVMVNYFTGYNPKSGKWEWESLKVGLIPIVAGFAVHFVASKLGINRMLGRARVPVIRI